VTTVLITGATDGLGKALALRLAAEGVEVIAHGRDPVRLSTTGIELNAVATGPRARTVLADLADLGQVRRLAADIHDLTHSIDAFVSNAGIGSGLPAGRTRQTSVDGYELRFAVNYLAGFRLTLDLLDLLEASAPARIVNVASIGQHPIDFDDLMIERGYSGSRAYGQSKLAQVMSGFTLAGRLSPDAVTVNSLHPATYMPTKMVMQEVGHSIDSLTTGVEATHRLVADPALAGVSGLFFDRTREAKANPQAYDEAARDLLWQRSLDLVGQ
jgi:NAD(P)-dependent dehydrogenase (short-subunit alcohol dehydrogenase family)